MPFKIVLDTESVSYEYKPETDDTESVSDEYEYETYQTETISLKANGSRWWYETGDYKEPDDVVVENVYVAKSQHGDFEWTVCARSSGFSILADIEAEELTKCPRGCELQDMPSFSIEYYEVDEDGEEYEE